MNRQDISNLYNKIESLSAKSAWKNGVKEYALELVESLYEMDFDIICNKKLLSRALLNGANDWNQYSAGGCSLIHDCDIAERLCTDSELERIRDGEKQPNSRESWLDVQARALYQAEQLILENY